MRSLTFPERSAFPPIADYALLSDCEVAALVAPSGNVEWLCLPQFDSPSVFSSMLDRGAGRFRFGPADAQVPTARRYLPGSMVVETTWKVRTGWLVVRDALTVGPWHHTTERAHRQRRAPNDWEADHTLVRTARCAQGMVELQLECEPRFEYGAQPAAWEYGGDGYHDARATARRAPTSTCASTTDMNVGFEGPRADRRARRCARARRRSWRSAGRSTRARRNFHEAFERVNATSEYWREWLSHGDFPDHPWRSHLERSALTLKGLQYAPSGGVRRPRRRRRCRASRAASATGTTATRSCATRRSPCAAPTRSASTGRPTTSSTSSPTWAPSTAASCRTSTPCPAASRAARARRSTTCPGYLGARPVRVGNDAASVEQHDVWGEIVDAVYIHAKTRDKLPERVWPLVKKQVELAAERWSKPDRGIWALRGDPQHYVSSKVMCWVALDRGAAARRPARRAGARRAVARGRARDPRRRARARPRRARRVHPALRDDRPGRVSAPDPARAASCRRRDHRVRKTVLAIQDELVEGGLVLRHRPDDPKFAVEGEAFAVCSFWLVSALDEIGEKDAARELCERLLAYASPLGPVRRAPRPGHRPPPGQLPARVHAPGAGQRAVARDGLRGLPGAAGRGGDAGPRRRLVGQPRDVACRRGRP